MERANGKAFCRTDFPIIRHRRRRRRYVQLTAPL